MVYLLLVLAILTNSCNTYVLAVDDNGMDLPLEISEKYYKKDSILKFNQAVGKWGQRDVKKESVDEAIILWSEAVSVDPNLWVAYLGLGQAYDLKKEYKKSLEAYNNYLTLAPKEAPDKKTVIESVEYLTHLLKHGEEALVSEDYLKMKHWLVVGTSLFIKGKVQLRYMSTDQFELKITAMQLLSEIRENLAKSITLNIALSDISENVIQKLSKVVKANTGKCKLSFNVMDNIENTKVELYSKSLKVNLTNEFIAELDQMPELSYKLN